MDIPDNPNTYTHEYIMQWDTDGVDEWNATRKEKLIRCKECKWWHRDSKNNYGYCKGLRKWETGYCDEAINLENTI